jgi:hypothetical protein
MDRPAKIAVIARSVHEAIRAYQDALGEEPAPTWDKSDWMQESTREAVEFALDSPTPGAQHEAWASAKGRAGWRYGPTKDANRKTHPSLVPFEQLAETEQRKDAILIAVVQALAHVLDVTPVGESYHDMLPSRS